MLRGLALQVMKRIASAPNERLAMSTMLLMAGVSSLLPTKGDLCILLRAATYLTIPAQAKLPI